ARLPRRIGPRFVAQFPFPILKLSLCHDLPPSLVGARSGCDAQQPSAVSRSFFSPSSPTSVKSSAPSPHPHLPHSAPNRISANLADYFGHFARLGSGSKNDE